MIEELAFARYVGIGSNYRQFMNDIAYGTTLGFLIVMQWLLIWQCIKTRGHVTGHVSDLGTEMGNLGTLLDEALDYIAELPSGAMAQNPMIAQAGGSMQEMLLGALMSKISNAPDHGTSKEERQISESEETNE